MIHLNDTKYKIKKEKKNCSENSSEILSSTVQMFGYLNYIISDKTKKIAFKKKRKEIIIVKYSRLSENSLFW